MRAISSIVSCWRRTSLTVRRRSDGRSPTFAAIDAANPGYATMLARVAKRHGLGVRRRTKRRLGCSQSAFDRLALAADVEPYLDLNQAARLYAGFLDRSEQLRGARFPRRLGQDWQPGLHRYDAGVRRRATAFGLLYEKVTGDIGRLSTIGQARRSCSATISGTRPSPAPRARRWSCCASSSAPTRWSIGTRSFARLAIRPGS